MKFQVTFKTPDCADDAIHSEIINKYGMRLDEIEREYLNSEERTLELEQIRENAFNDMHKMTDCLDKFCSYREYITVEFDTETQTVEVVK